MLLDSWIQQPCLLCFGIDMILCFVSSCAQNSLCWKWLLLMSQAASVVCRQDCNCNWIVSSGFQTAISVWFNLDRSYSLSMLHVLYVHFYSTCIFNNTPLLVLNSACLPISHSIKSGSYTPWPRPARMRQAEEKALKCWRTNLMRRMERRDNTHTKYTI